LPEASYVMLSPSYEVSWSGKLQTYVCRQ